jgi:hypothetical protein
MVKRSRFSSFAARLLPGLDRDAAPGHRPLVVAVSCSIFNELKLALQVIAAVPRPELFFL